MDEEFCKFLKKYSSIDDKFIDDFYKFFPVTQTSGSEFVINLDVVSKWLNVRKNNLKTTLIDTYIVNVDYTIKKPQVLVKTHGGQNKELIMLTTECFKRLCLLSKTKLAEKVRTYFLEMETLLSKYKSYIIEALNKKLKILENNQKEIPKNTKGVIYVLRSMKDIDEIYRFGQTNDFKKRVANYNSANSDKMEVVFVYEVDDIEKIEKCVINLIKEQRYKKRKDFYEIDKSILKKIIKDCEKLTLKYKNIIANKNMNKKTIANQKRSLKDSKLINNDNLYIYIKK